MIDLSGPLLEVAPRLLGCVLVQDGVAVRLTEVEAYAGADDAAAHAFIGPRPRTRALFGRPGTLYCYLSYGIHICGNLVCGGGSAVLLRAGEVVQGLDVARARRPGVAVTALARGPGNLGRVLGWTLAASGRRLGEDGLELVAQEPVSRWESGPRVGVSVAHGRPWRFWLPDSASVSPYRRSPRIRNEGDH